MLRNETHFVFIEIKTINQKIIDILLNSHKMQLK